MTRPRGEKIALGVFLFLMIIVAVLYVAEILR